MPDPAYEADPLPAVRAPHEGAFCLQRLAALAAARWPPDQPFNEPSRSTVDPLLAQPFADEELEGRPRAPAGVEHPVHLPFGQQRLALPGAPPPSR